MSRKHVRFGIIGLGLMGREFAANTARWCQVLDDGPVPVVAGICSRTEQRWRWYTDNFDSVEIATTDYRKLLASDKVDAVYCAVPHNLHEEMYTATIRAGKHLLAEKPFGIDLAANSRILEAVETSPEVVVRCCSQFPYYSGAARLVGWISERRYGRLIEVRAGFHHSSDMDLNKPINWKRRIETNGEYGCMGDLGLHVMHIPIRMGWVPTSVFAHLQNIAEQRPDSSGAMVPCETLDNATLVCSCADPTGGKPFLMTLETKRMAPGATNTWFLEVYGTEGSARFTTHDPRAFYTLEVQGREQGWTRTDIGAKSYLPTITGAIFETGFSDALQQMMAAFMTALDGRESRHPFPMATPEETAVGHRIMTAALRSHESGNRVALRAL